jgi:hypothetical protein
MPGIGHMSEHHVPQKQLVQPLQHPLHACASDRQGRCAAVSHAHHHYDDVHVYNDLDVYIDNDNDNNNDNVDR